MFSFEEGAQGWVSGQTPNPGVSTSTFGATEGTMALHITGVPGGFQNDIGRSELITATSRPEAFAQFELAAAEVAAGRRPQLEFDLTIDPGTATPVPTWLQLGMFLNSRGGYKDYGTGGLLGGNLGDTYPVVESLAASHGVTLTNIGANQYHVAIPMRLPSEVPGGNQGLSLASGEFPYYEIGFKSNGGVTSGSFNYGIDNIRWTGIPTFTETTLFSWETPDNPGTPGVDEAFEGWVTTNEVPAPPAGMTLQPGHDQSIGNVGATDGANAYQIDRRDLPNGFTWGSAFALNGAGDPATQTRINDLVSLINGADRIAFDVTYKDMFNEEGGFISPSFTGFAVHFADGTGAFYQAEAGFVDLNTAGAGTTSTFEIALSEFDDATAGSTKNLAVDGLIVGASFLEIGIATNTDDGGIYQIDNFRVLTQDTGGNAADFDGDGVVDGADLQAWKTAFGPSNAGGDADGDGDSDGADFLTWQRQVGASSSLAAVAAVPEPAGCMLLAGASLAICLLKRR
ncbi:MAG TPA: hypothetical protein VF175_08060 [Lacipirellula sp.]